MEVAQRCVRRRNQSYERSPWTRWWAWGLRGLGLLLVLDTVAFALGGVVFKVAIRPEVSAVASDESVWFLLLFAVFWWSWVLTLYAIPTTALYLSIVWWMPRHWESRTRRAVAIALSPIVNAFWMVGLALQPDLDKFEGLIYALALLVASIVFGVLVHLPLGKGGRR
jgi:hypothetical protein